MARFDVYLASGDTLVVDCQAEVFDDIGTRFVVPLLPPGNTPPVDKRLNPSLTVNGESLILLPQFATSVRTIELRARVGTLAHEHITIISAIDMLIGGY